MIVMTTAEKITNEKLRPWECRQCLLAIVPLKANERARDEVLHEEANSLHTDAEIAEFLARRRAEVTADFELQRIPGFTAAVASLLSIRYNIFCGDTRAFCLCHYDLLLSHIFTPPDKRDEQVISDVGVGQPYNFTSILSLISANIQAMYLYCNANRLGRRRYLAHCYFPLVDELFRGFEYLARLHSLDLGTERARERLTSFLRQICDLDEEYLDALWEFRCGIVHRGTLYNATRNGIFRFSFGCLGRETFVIRRKASPERFLEGRGYDVSGTGLLRLYLKAVSFVAAEMHAFPQRYAGSDRFHEWLRTSWTEQYLFTSEEHAKMARPPEPSRSAILDKLSAIGAQAAEYRFVTVRRNSRKLWMAGWAGSLGLQNPNPKCPSTTHRKKFTTKRIVSQRQSASRSWRKRCVTALAGC